MLFSSYVFIFAFLPLAVLCFYLLNRHSRTAALVGLVAFSLFYYGFWNWRYVPLLVGSILVNFWLGRQIQQRRAAGGMPRLLLAGGIAGNLALLAYYKYAMFVAGLFGAAPSLGVIVLPLAISFFTFQQIAYLVDSWHGNVTRDGLLPYAVFVTFFPHLIAGPILHHREMMPQFSSEDGRRLRLEDLSVGLTLFFIGLAKKVVIADQMALHATPAFSAAAAGQVDFYTAWVGVLAYTFQIYFDFSGYSDMAVGAARMLGIRLPANFFSPYRARNIIEFWRRWHMTLSRLLRNYLYIPLGGNRKGPARRHLNLMITMLLGGLWHGAGWTFVVWGALHGLYLVINHGWQGLRRRMGWERESRAGAALATLVTFLAVVIAWVFFRAQDLPTALRMLEAMAGLHGISLPARMPPLPWFLALLAVVWFAPNSYQITRAYDPVLMPERFRTEPAPLARLALAWRPTPAWAFALAAIVVSALIAMLSDRMEFLYYQF